MKSKKYMVGPIILIYLLTLLLPFTAIADVSQPEVLSIQDAITSALKDNPDLIKAGYDVDKAQEQRDDASDQVTWMPEGGMVLPAYQQVVNSYQQAEIGLTTAKRTLEDGKDNITKQVINAYTSALKSYNSMQTMQISLRDMKQQKLVSSLAKEVGLISDYDYAKLNSSIQQMEESYTGAQKSYQSSIVTLGELLGKGENWEPQLTSQASLNTYKRNELSTEISRGTSESVLVWTKKALLEIEESKKYWVLPNVSSTSKRISLDTAQLDYEQAKDSARSSIESMYYSIDALEGQIASAETASAQAQKDLQIAQLKYDLGLIAATSMTGGESLASAKTAAQKAQISLDNARADLVNLKAQFAYLTGQTVYDEKDWSTPATVSTDK